MKNHKLGEILEAMGALRPEETSRVLARQRQTGQKFGQLAVMLDLATREQVWEAWARQMTQQETRVDLDEFGVDSAALQGMSESVARRFRCVPLRLWGAHLVVAVGDPAARAALLGSDLAEEYEIHCCYCDPRQIDRYLTHAYLPPAPIESRHFEAAGVAQAAAP